MSVRLFLIFLSFYSASGQILGRGSECTARNNIPGTCTTMAKCAPVMAQLKAKTLQANPPVICDPGSGLVCCPLSTATTTTTTTTTQAPETTRKSRVFSARTRSGSDETGPDDDDPGTDEVVTQPPRISELKCREYSKFNYETRTLASINPDEPPVKKVFDVCLHKMTPLIIGGQETKLGEFPHQALLGYKIENSKNMEWKCGGSLVSENFILTAAHCAFTPKVAKLGIITREQTTSMSKRNIAEIYVHPDYDKKARNNDIALLKLSSAIPLSNRMFPVCLPQTQLEPEKAIVIGFGYTVARGSGSNELLKVTLERFSHEECTDKYSESKIKKDSMLCYGHHTESKDSCNEDSGGPLQIYHENCTYMQVGIVSFGPISCGSIGAPGIYTNVYNYLDWIEGIIWPSEAKSEDY